MEVMQTSSPILRLTGEGVDTLSTSSFTVSEEKIALTFPRNTRSHTYNWSRTSKDSKEQTC